MGRSGENKQVCTVFLTPYSVYTRMNSDLFRNFINFIVNNIIGKVESFFSHSFSFVTSYCSARWSLRIHTREQWWQRRRHCQRGKIANFSSCKLQDCILQAEVTSQGCILNLADAWEGAVGGWRRPKL